MHQSDMFLFVVFTAAITIARRYIQYNIYSSTRPMSNYT